MLKQANLERSSDSGAVFQTLFRPIEVFLSQGGLAFYCDCLQITSATLMTKVVQSNVGKKQKDSD